jgi:hypothetical protein
MDATSGATNSLMAALNVEQQQQFWKSVTMRPVTLHWERNGEPLVALENGFIIQQTRASRRMLIVSTWLLLITQLGATAYDQQEDEYTTGQLRIMLVIRLGIMTPTVSALVPYAGRLTTSTNKPTNQQTNKQPSVLHANNNSNRHQNVIPVESH